MSVVIMLLRVLGRLVLGLAVVVGLLHLLVLVNFTERLEDNEIYYVAVDETDAYDRVYDEVLVDEAFREQTDNLLGDIEIELHDQVVNLLRELLPPEYLQEQTEDNIDRWTSYLREETDKLELYVELQEPLERILPTARAEVHRLIDALDIPEVVEAGCSSDTVRRLASDAAPPLQQLSNGRLPESAPSLRVMDQACREGQFERWFDVVVNDPALNSQASLLLADAREELRQPFVQGDTRAFLKAAAEPLIGPLTEDAVADIRRELQPNDRLDLLQLIAEQSDDITREEIESDAEDLRDVVIVSNGPAKVIALVLVVAGSVLLALIHLPNPAQVLRWPGIVLTIGGAVCLAVGFILNSAFPGQFKRAVAYALDYSGDVPRSVINLGGDILESFGRQSTEGFITLSVTVIVVGVALIAASFLLGALAPAARRMLPGSGGRDK